MKKIIILTIIAIACLSMSACAFGADNENDYAALIDRIEAGDYAGAFSELNKFFGDGELQLEAVMPTTNIAINGTLDKDVSQEERPTETIVITEENFFEYFELKEKCSWSHDAFGVANYIMLRERYVLKEEYQDRLPSESDFSSTHSVGIEVSFTEVLVEFYVDYEKETYSFGQRTAEAPTQVTKLQKVYTNDHLGGATDELYMTGIGCSRDQSYQAEYVYSAIEDVSLIRAEGEITLYKDN